MIYDAFVSYSQSTDKRLAKAIVRGLEQFAKPWKKRRSLNVFLDEASLSVNADLWESIKRRLLSSANLVVLLSPEAAQSIWVNKEITTWLSQPDSPESRVFLVLTSGTLSWNQNTGDFDHVSTALPASLVGVFKSEPLHLDLRWVHQKQVKPADLNLRNSGFRLAIARLAAAITDKELSDLESQALAEEQRQRRLRNAAILSLFLLTVVAILSAISATKSEREALRRERQAKSLTLTAESAAIKSKDSALSLVLATEGYARADEPTSRQAQAIADAIYDFDRGTWQIYPPIRRHDSPVLSLSFSHDGKWLATGDLDGGVRIFDPKNRQFKTLIESDIGFVKSLAFSPDSRVLAIGGQDGSVQILETESWTLKKKRQLHDGSVVGLSFADRSRYLVTTGIDGVVAMMDLVSDSVAWKFEIGEPLQSVHVSDDDGWILTASGSIGEPSSTIHILDMSGKLVKAIEVTEKIVSISYSANARLLAAGTHRGSVRFFSIPDGHERSGSLFTQQSVASLAFSPDGSTLASGGDDGSILIWDVGKRRPINELGGHRDTVWDLAWHPSIGLLASASWDTLVGLATSADYRRIVRSLQPHGSQLNDLIVVDELNSIMTAGTDGAIRIQNVYSDSIDTFFAVPEVFLKSLAYSSDLNLVAVTVGGDTTTRVWKLDTRELIHEYQHPVEVNESIFLPGGDLVTADVAGNLRIWSTSTGSLQRTLSGHKDPIYSLSVSPKGNRLASGDEAGMLRLWDPRSGSEIIALVAHEDYVNDLDFSPKGSIFASVGEGGNVRMWDGDSGESLWSINGHSGPATEVEFIQGGDMLVTAGPAAQINLWNADNGTVVQRNQLRIGSVAALDVSRQSNYLFIADRNGAVKTFPIFDFEYYCEIVSPFLDRSQILQYMPEGELPMVCTEI